MDASPRHCATQLGRKSQSWVSPQTQEGLIHTEHPNSTVPHVSILSSCSSGRDQVDTLCLPRAQIQVAAVNYPESVYSTFISQDQCIKRVKFSFSFLSSTYLLAYCDNCSFCQLNSSIASIRKLIPPKWEFSLLLDYLWITLGQQFLLEVVCQSIEGPKFCNLHSRGGILTL